MTLDTKENAAVNWLKLMDLKIGEEVLILPLGGPAGQGLQGTLVDLVVNAGGPLIVIIRRSPDTAVVSVPWSAMLMITRPNTPPVPVETKPTEDITVDDLIAMAEKMGVNVPSQIRDVAAAK